MKRVSMRILLAIEFTYCFGSLRLTLLTIQQPYSQYSQAANLMQRPFPRTLTYNVLRLQEHTIHKEKLYEWARHLRFIAAIPDNGKHEAIPDRAGNSLANRPSRAPNLNERNEHEEQVWAFMNGSYLSLKRWLGSTDFLFLRIKRSGVSTVTDSIETSKSVWRETVQESFQWLVCPFY